MIKNYQRTLLTGLSTTLLVCSVNAETIVISDNNEPNYVQKDYLKDTEIEKAEKAKPLENNRMSKQEMIDALKKEDPKKVETTLVNAIYKLNIPGISLLLPAYKEYDNKDDSLVEWGQALIDGSTGKYKKSITALEKIHKRIPEAKTLQFHIALIKYKNNKLNAAKKDLDRLKKDDVIVKKHGKSIDLLLANIKKRNKSHFSGGINYLSNDNLGGTPKEGTVLGNGFIAGPREKGKGAAISLSLSKRLHFDNGMYNDAAINLGSSIYVNNKKFNILTLTGSYGIGYKDARSDFKIEPFLTKMYYGGGGSNKTEYLKSYRKSYGGKVFTTFNLGSRSSYSNVISFTQNDYVKKFDANNSLDFSINNSLIYNYYSSRFVLGYDFFDRDSVSTHESFHRNGVRFAWSKNWYNHIITHTNTGYGYKKYADEDFFGNLKRNNEYNVGVSIYSPHIQLFGIMPSVNWSYNKTVSNIDSENSSGHNVDFNIGRSF